MALINISSLTFCYDGSYDNIFEDVSFQIDTDWKLGFIGRNGRGKTTFLKLLMGQYEYKGTISAPVSFEYFPYEVRDASKNSIDVIEEVCPDLEYWKLQREMAKLEVGEDTLYRPFSTLSNGERTKLLLAAMFLRENSFLLIDEPTNHLDMRGRALVSDYLASKKGFILVSHDRAFLDGAIDHVLSINRANIEVQRGNYSSWSENKRRQDSFELAENEKLKGEIKRLKETAREKADWSDTAERRKTGVDSYKVDNIKGWRPLQGAKSKKQMSRAKAIEGRQQRAIEEKEKLLKNIEKSEELKISQAEYHSKRLILMRDAAISYGEKTVCEGITFTVEQGDRLAITGRNGSGKSSLLKLICGEDMAYTGTVQIGSGLIISYVPQDTSELTGNLTDYAREYGIDESVFKAILRKLDFERVQFEKDMRDFSAGQKKKVLIARSLCEKAHLHVWDEPMNYIDVISRTQLEELILSFKPTLVFVEHDRVFCDKIATKTLEM